MKCAVQKCLGGGRGKGGTVLLDVSGFKASMQTQDSKLYSVSSLSRAGGGDGDCGSELQRGRKLSSFLEIGLIAPQISRVTKGIPTPCSL